MAVPNFQADLPIRTILVPQGAEYRAVRKGCDRAQAAVSVVPLPLGQAAGKRLEGWLAKYKLFSDSGYLLVGLGGGLSPDLKVGEAILCETIQGPDQTEPIRFAPHLNEWIRTRLPGIEMANALGCDRIIVLAAEKQALQKQYGTSVVEMESLSVFKTLQSQGKQLAMVRVISDDCRDDLPDIARAMQPDGGLNPFTLATCFMGQPIGAGRLIAGSLKGLRSLEKLVYSLFEAS